MRSRWIVLRLIGLLLPLLALGLAARLAGGDENKVPVIYARPSATGQKWLAPTGTVLGPRGVGGNSPPGPMTGFTMHSF